MDITHLLIIYIVILPIFAIIKHKYFRDVWANADSRGGCYNDRLDNIMLSLIWPIFIAFAIIMTPFYLLSKLMEKMGCE